MSHAVSQWAWVLVLAICLSPSSLPQTDSRAQSPASAASDEATLRDIVEKFFVAYGKKDLAGALTALSERSPDFVIYKQSLHQQFTTRDVSFGTPVISRVKLGSDKASLRVTVALTSISLKSKQKREDRLQRNFEFVREGDEWRVWRYAPAVNDLADGLVKAKGAMARVRLLSEEKELVTAELVTALINRGERLFDQWDNLSALSIYRLAQNIAEQIGYREGIIVALNDIGLVHYRQADFELAMDFYRKGLKLAEELGSKAMVALILSNIGDLQFRKGNYGLALESFERGLTQLGPWEVNKDILLRGKTLSGIGSVHLSQSNYDLALKYLEQVLSHYKALDSRSSMASTLERIGKVHAMQGKYDLALEYYQQCLSLSADAHESRENEGGIATILGVTGDVYRLQGNYDLALDYYQKSLAKLEAWAEKGGNKLAIAKSLDDIGNILRLQGRYEQALECTERAADLARQLGGVETLWRARLASGTSYRALHRPAQARHAFEEAITTIEALRSQAVGGEQDIQRFFESKVSAYHAMMELLIAQNNPAEALTFAERARARVLLDVLYSGRANATKAMTAQERERERELNGLLISLNTQIYRANFRPQPDQARLVDLKAQLQQARLDFEAFQTNLYAAHPELKVQRGEARPLRLEEAGALLPDAETALLEFVVAEEKTHIFVITKRASVELKVYQLDVKRKDLTHHAERFRQLLSTLDNRFTKPARELYDLLLKPAAEQLRGKTRLVIVPDGPLWELPFQALRTPQDRHLVADHTISYAPSLTALREMIKARRQEARPSVAPTLLALGNPSLGNETLSRVKAVMMDERLDPLPEAERQVQALTGIYGPGRSRVYVGAEARERRFKAEAGDHRILHLATHGILNDRSPMYSHLLLAQAGGDVEEDGLLEAWELMRLDLKADLAVLSACETARGRVGQGEGMIGLTWALFVAGVPRTVVSQWKVRSDSTAELMVEFHRRLQARPAGPSGRGGVAEALRGAALKLAGDRRYRHPFHWAGFIVVGDGY